MKLSIDKTTVLAITIPMVALLFVGYISYENMIQFIQKDAADDRINLVNQRLNNIISTTANAETGRSGYISNTIDYLQSSNSALRDIHSQLGNLDMMVADGPANQRLSLNELNMGLIEAELAKLNQTITLRQLHGVNAALPIIPRNTGKALMDKIRAIAVDIQSHNNNMLDNRQSDAYAQTISYTIIITIVAAAGITSVLVHAINRDIHRRHLTVQRSLQTEVEKRRGIAGCEQSAARRKRTVKASRQDAARVYQCSCS